MGGLSRGERIALAGVTFASIAALGLFDLVLAWLFASGRIGPQSARRAAAEAGDAAAIAEADRSYNPYARED